MALCLQPCCILWLGKHRGCSYFPPPCPYNIPFYLLSPSPGPCHPNPCHNNGECQLVPNRGDVFTDYVCKCPAGYDGVHCQNSEYSRLGAGGAGGGSSGTPGPAPRGTW